MTTSEPWMAQFNRKPYYLLNQNSGDIDLPSLVLAMGHLARYNGQTTTAYVLTSHSNLVARMVKLRWPGDIEAELYAQMHDCHEVFWGDILRPVQIAIEQRLPGFRELWKEFTSTADRAIFQAFGLPDSFPSSRAVDRVKEADTAVLVFERRARFIDDDEFERRWPGDASADWWLKTGLELIPFNIYSAQWRQEVDELIHAVWPTEPEDGTL